MSRQPDRPTVPPDRAGGEDSRSLRRANLGVGLVHLVQAVIMVALSNDLTLPVTAAFLQGDPLTGIKASPRVLFELPIGLAVAMFLLLAAADHLAVVLPGLDHRYEANLRRGVNYARWIEYSASASLMVALIAMFTGIWDVAALVGLVGANAAMIWFGLLMERHQEPGAPDWAAFAFGTAVGLVPWLAIGIYLIGAATPPTFVYVIYLVQLAFFASFGLNQYLQYRRVGPWREYIYGEHTYIWLSLGAKSMLAWLIFANVLRS